MTSEDDKANALNKLGKLLIETLKDNRLEAFDELCEGKRSDAAGLALHKALSEHSPAARNLMRDCIADAVIGGIHDFLHELEDMYRYDKCITFTVDGFNPFEISDGLYAELFSEHGWDARFSKYPTQESILQKYMEKYGIAFPEPEFDENGDLL